MPYWLVSNGLEWSTRFPAGLADDCDVGKTGKKACKNCSCGRAEMEEQGVKLTADMLENPQSACGNVSQGVIGEEFRPEGTLECEPVVCSILAYIHPCFYTSCCSAPLGTPSAARAAPTRVCRPLKLGRRLNWGETC